MQIPILIRLRYFTQRLTSTAGQPTRHGLARTAICTEAHKPLFFPITYKFKRASDGHVIELKSRHSIRVYRMQPTIHFDPDKKAAYKAYKTGSLPLLELLQRTDSQLVTSTLHRPSPQSHFHTAIQYTYVRCRNSMAHTSTLTAKGADSCQTYTARRIPATSTLKYWTLISKNTDTNHLMHTLVSTTNLFQADTFSSQQRWSNFSSPLPHNIPLTTSRLLWP